jgi:hypothetical protein
MPNVQQSRRRRRKASAISYAVTKREAGRGLAHKNILAGGAVACGRRVARPTACMAAHTVPRQVRP